MIKSSFEKSFKIKIDDVGFDKLISLKKLMENFQIIATEHADILGFGFAPLRQKNLAWTINRIKIDFLSDVKAGNLLFTTWPLCPKHFTCDRDFFAVDENGNKVILGTSTWNLFDLEKRCLFPANDMQELKLEYSDSRSMDDLCYERVVFGEDYKKVYSYSPSISDLDVNDHVNNTNYINFAINCLSKEEYAENIKGFEIKFQRELKYKDLLDLYLKRENGKRLVVGKRGDETVFSCCIHLKNER